MKSATPPLRHTNGGQDKRGPGQTVDREQPDLKPGIRSILVVDDDRLILKFMGDLLRKEGYEVMTAPDGLSALDILKTHTPQVIFLDLVMPGIDGENLCRIIREKIAFRNVYITILSATLAEEPMNMIELGADACIAKGPLEEIARNVLFVLREPHNASSRCSSGEILGIGDVHPRIMTRQLLSLKKHFDMVMEKMSQGMVELTPEGRILFANPSALLQISMPEHQLLGSTFANLFEGDDRLRVEQFIEALKGQAGSISYEAPVILNGKALCLEMLRHGDREAAIFVMMTDVTERKKEETVLIDSEHQLGKVIFNNSDAMIVADGDGVVRLVNPAAETLFGRQSHALVGASFGFPFIAAETTELDVVTRSGEARVAEMRVTKTEWKGEPAYLASARDITERVRMASALEEANRKILEQQEKLVEEERLKVMLQMAGATAHEFNQPLSILLGNVELLEMESDDPKLFAESLQDIKTAGRRIADMVKKVQNIRYYETKPYGKSGIIVDIDQDIRILSIEDSDSDFEIIQTVLGEIDHVNLIRAGNIADAIPLLTDTKIDLVLLDYALPDGNGFDFMKKAREKGIETTVVVLTGEGDEMIASRLIREGAFDYMTKDVFDVDNISRCICHVLEKDRLQREIGLAQNKIVQMAVIDTLTGLHNRRYLFETLDREKKRAQRYGSDLVVCMIDLDHFKEINDTHGHPAGDAVLKEMDKLIKHWARETDFPCRYGGEEFAVVMPETSLEGSCIACERLRRMVAEHGFEHETLTLKITISIGISHYDQTAEQTVSDLMNNADKALYQAKEAGRNRVNVS